MEPGKPIISFNCLTCLESLGHEERGFLEALKQPNQPRWTLALACGMVIAETRGPRDTGARSSVLTEAQDLALHKWKASVA